MFNSFVTYIFRLIFLESLKYCNRSYLNAMKKIIYVLSLLFMGIINLFGQQKSKTPVFKFKEAENTACIVCSHILSKQLPILYAAHDAEGDWQFLCGKDNHTEENAKVISLKEVVEIDPSVNDLFEMPNAVGTDRKTVKDKWKPFRL